MSRQLDEANRLNRTVKLALDTGEAASVEEAERIFGGYRLQIVAGAEVAEERMLQATLLTAINCAARTFLGGVTVVGGVGSLRAELPIRGGLAEAVTALGGQAVDSVDPTAPTLVIGDASATAVESLAVRATAAGWCCAVTPTRSLHRLDGRGTIAPAAVAAAALGVSEIFQRLRGDNPMACRRSVGLNLWRPELDWSSSERGPSLLYLPASAWLVGLGNLGQAYLWVLGLLPYARGDAEFVLQDFDFIAQSNLSTSMLTTSGMLGSRKTRMIADWAEARGFRTAIVERSFESNFRVGPREPQVALIGVDNPLARQSIEDVGFERVIEAGLGWGPRDFLGIDLHTFPASKSARSSWAELEVPHADIAKPAYAAMLERTGDRCGTVQLAGRSVGAPFVGAIAASLVVAELLRLARGDHRNELLSCHLRDLASRVVVRGTPWGPCNPGTVPARS